MNKAEQVTRFKRYGVIALRNYLKGRGFNTRGWRKKRLVRACVRLETISSGGVGIGFTEYQFDDPTGVREQCLDAWRRTTGVRI